MANELNFPDGTQIYHPFYATSQNFPTLNESPYTVVEANGEAYAFRRFAQTIKKISVSGYMITTESTASTINNAFATYGRVFFVDGYDITRLVYVENYQVNYVAGSPSKFEVEFSGFMLY